MSSDPTESPAGPVLTKLEQGPAEFVASEARRRRSRNAWNSMIDVRGGLAAEQAGLVVEAAQRALILGIQAFLLGNGFPPVAPEFCVRALEAYEEPLHRKASMLLMQPPTDPGDVQVYAQKCELFLRDTLKVTPPDYSPGNTDDTSSEEFWQIAEEVNAIAEYISGPSPFPPEERARSLNL